MPFGTLRFESKSRRYDFFELWVSHILGQPSMEKFLEDLGILRSINLARFTDLKRNPIDLAFLLLRWSTSSHTFVAVWGELYRSLEDVAMLTRLPQFGNVNTVDILDEEGRKQVEELQAPASKSKYSTNK